MKPALNTTDLRILKTLQSEGRLSNVELADRIALSPSPCLRRVKQLEGDGLITGYSARLDRRKLGLDVMAFVEVQVDRAATTAETFKAAIMREPEVIGCYVMTGAYDYLLQVVVPNLDAYSDLALNRLLKIPGIKDVRSSFVLDEVKDSRILPLDGLATQAGT